MSKENKGWFAVLVIIVAIILAIITSCGTIQKAYWIEITHWDGTIDTIRYDGWRESEFKLVYPCIGCHMDLVTFNPNMPIKAMIIGSKVSHYRIIE